MARIIMELTNRCNLSCQHCFAERHAATGDLPLGIIDKIIKEGKACGIDHLCFTGGEATIHRQFGEIVDRVCRAGYDFSFVSNGMNFPQLYPRLKQYRKWFKGVTFSLDGASERTHDGLRGKGSYRRVMQAVSTCVFQKFPFTLNMVVTKKNRAEVEVMICLAGKLGSRGIRFGYLMPTPETSLRGLDLSPQETREVQDRIWRLKDSAPVSVSMGPGYYSESPFFPCAPLELQEFNVDYRGNLSLCCQLSGYSGERQGTDVVGNLRDMTLTTALKTFRRRVSEYLADKHTRVSRGDFDPIDHFPCWYCMRYLGKATALEDFRNHPWASA